MTTTNTLGIVFYLKRPNAHDGKAPIYVRITVDGKRALISLKTEVEIKNWDEGKGMLKAKSSERL